MAISAKIALVICGWAATTVSGATNALPLRVWAVTNDTFDYVFMSAIRQANGDAMLSFNDRSGRTAFRKIGQQLDAWKIVRYEPATREEPNPKTGSVSRSDAGKVWLRNAAGDTRVLQQGRSLPDDGRRATVVDIVTGGWFSVRSGDHLAVGQTRLPVTAIGTNTVTVAHAGQTSVIPAITPDETAGLQARLVAQMRAREEAEARRQADAARAEAEAWAQAARYVPPADDPSPKQFPARPRLITGTSGPIPVEYTILPPLFDNTGRMVRGPIVVPTRFETRTIGGYEFCTPESIVVPSVKIAPR